MGAARYQATKMDDYLFDLRGYLHLKGAIDPEHVAAMNRILDTFPKIQPNEWHGYVHRENVPQSRGSCLQQIYEAGEPFERLIDHPRWVDLLKRYVGGEGSFDWHHGPLFIDEAFACIRGPHEAIGMHSGNAECNKKLQYHYQCGKFMCGQINILMALTDVGPGDGGTMLIPGSHKANFRHPGAEGRPWDTHNNMEGIEGAIEVHMKAGDVLLFVDAITHGAAERKNPGERRMVVYRYGSTWGNFRFGYVPSPELLARLNPEARGIVYPWKHMIPPGVAPILPGFARETVEA
ncbi:MAG TPA: phytanoyl-CoA dioxygenase family protein [Planctomycetota bacterium]|nr:phytanoyl-CoA dioxygenase family protein [Planctomycetota bacterium]